MRGMIPLAGALALGSATSAWSQIYEIAPTVSFERLKNNHLGSLSTSKPKNDDTKIRNGFAYGLRLTWNTKGYYGHELSYLFSRPEVQTRIVDPDTGLKIQRTGRATVQQAAYTFMMYMMPAGERWRPFLAAGMQANQYGGPKIAEWDRGSSRNLGGHYGGGLKIRLAKHLLVRFDVRHFIGGKPYSLQFESMTDSSGIAKPEARGKLKHLEGSFGIGLAF